MKNAKTAGERRAQLDFIVIDNSRQQHALSVCEFLMAHAEARPGEPTRCAPLIGPSQSGKTTIIRAIAKKYNTIEALEDRMIPILPVTLQSNATRKQVLQNVLQAFEDFGYADVSCSGNESVLLKRVSKYLKTARVRLLVLDEFHHAVRSENNTVIHSVGETVKWLLLDGVCPILVSGLEAALRPFTENAQLAHRAEAPIELEKLQLEKNEDASLFMGFLSRFLVQVEKAGFRNARTLLAPNIAGKIHQAADGVLGAACNLVKCAATTAADDGRDSIAMADLSVANDRLCALGLSKANHFCDNRKRKAA
jgi:hypothetical protein